MMGKNFDKFTDERLDGMVTSSYAVVRSYVASMGRDKDLDILMTYSPDTRSEVSLYAKRFSAYSFWEQLTYLRSRQMPAFLQFLPNMDSCA